MVFYTKIIGGAEILVSGDTIKVKGKKGELERKFNPNIMDVKIKEGMATVTPKSELKRVKACAGSVNAHLKNMIKGVTEGYTYKLKIVFEHFPINLAVQGDILQIKNFGGEKTPRKAKIRKGAKVEIAGNEVIITGADKEAVGQTAGSIESATKVKKRDIRVFQDGIYIIQKG